MRSPPPPPRTAAAAAGSRARAPPSRRAWWPQRRLLSRCLPNGTATQTRLRQKSRRARDGASSTEDDEDATADEVLGAEGSADDEMARALERARACERRLRNEIHAAAVARRRASETAHPSDHAQDAA